MTLAELQLAMGRKNNSTNHVWLFYYDVNRMFDITGGLALCAILESIFPE